MRIIGHGIDMVSIEWMKTELESMTKDWPGQFCSADERVHADDPPARKRW